MGFLPSLFSRRRKFIATFSLVVMTALLLGYSVKKYQAATNSHPVIEITDLILGGMQKADTSQLQTLANNTSQEQNNTLYRQIERVNTSTTAATNIVERDDTSAADDGDEQEGAEDEEEELEAMVHSSNTSNYVGNLELAKYYDFPLLTICQHIEKYSVTPLAGSKPLTREECRQKCGGDGSIYAILSRGRCTCTDRFEPKPLVNLESCNATCAADEPSCDVVSKPHNIAMRTGLYDGDKEWTRWMNVAEVNTRVRYRNCPRSKDADSECSADFERGPVQKSEPPKVSQYLIGCFTGYTVTKSSTAMKESTKIKTEGQTGHEKCRTFCSSSNATYAYLSSNSVKKNSPRRCYCTNTLAKSQPTDSCSRLGYVVYWSSTEQDKVVLKFEGEVKKKGKVMVLARYRSGSSMTQSFFVKNPNSFTLFEPCKLKANPRIKDPEETDRALLMALEAVYSCNVHKLPAVFHNSPFLRWSNAMLSTRGQSQNHLQKVITCHQSSPKVNCAPYWLEACQMSEFLNVKVIRVFSVAAVREFIDRNTDVHVVHLVRDPRGLLSAQKRFGARPADTFLCNQLVEVGELIRDMKKKGKTNAHEVYYEELAINASYYGAKIYKEMRIEMPEEVRHFLSREEYDGKPIPKNAQQVVMKDPIAHVYGYLNRYLLDRIMEIDKHCTNVYKFWPLHYTDFWTVYKDHESDVYKYAASSKVQQIKQYLKSHPKLLT